MLPWLKNLLYDQATFTQYARVAVFLVGEALVAFGPTAPYYWVGKIVQGLALILRSGEMNSLVPPATA